ncbi:hypothetical protein MKW94_009635 [Papaver nudicaule]|uniref:Expansin n=1 Tax=Papaver nudicaule TaxID=74823 RepID=A0AA41V4J8_PAPNU|nr:hypothetical protein [Papaver nudicaule]
MLKPNQMKFLKKLVIAITVLISVSATRRTRGDRYYSSASSYSFTPSTTAIGEWSRARATYYAATDPRDEIGGACGYGDLKENGYGMATVGLSSSLFNRGQICGACFELRCVDDLKYCIPGTSIILTATNYCAPNYGLTVPPSTTTSDDDENDNGDSGGSDNVDGGLCNPPNKHFVLPIEAFEKIAIWKASNMPVQYRRIKCRREGGIRYTLNGSGFFYSVLITNVAGVGDVVAVKIKGSKTGWLPMGRNWGQNWHINADLKNQPLSFEVTVSNGVTITSYNVAPKDWQLGQTFNGKQFDS